MGLHSNEHLTTAQLSAYLDKELTGNERALCAAHVQTCPQCQAVLADVRATSVLLRGLPQVAVPRSFVLSPALAVLPGTPAFQEARRLRPPYVRRTLRVLSTLAAVIGLLFMLISGSALLPQGRYAASPASAPRLNGAAGNNSGTPPGTSSSTAPPEHRTEQATARATARVQERQTPAVRPAPSRPGVAGGPQMSLPAALDPTQPQGRLSIGIALLVLGILGVMLTRRSHSALP